MIPKLRSTARFAGWIVAALLCCGISSAWGQAPAAAPAVPEYVTADAFAMLDVRWGTLRKVPIWQYLHYGDIQLRVDHLREEHEPFHQFYGKLRDLAELDSIRLVFDGGELGAMPCGWYVVLRLTQPLDLRTLARDRLGFADSRKTSPEGFEYVAVPDFPGTDFWGSPLSILALDGRTAILAPESRLKKILAAKVSRGPLVEQWKLGTGEFGLRLVVIDSDTLRPLLEQAEKGGLSSGCDCFRLFGQHAHLRAVDIRCDSIAGDKMIDAKLYAKDEESGKAVGEWTETEWKNACRHFELEARRAELVVGADVSVPFCREYPTTGSIARTATTVEFAMKKTKTLDAAAKFWNTRYAESKLFDKHVAIWGDEGMPWDDRLPGVSNAIRQYAREHKRLPSDILSKDGKPLLSWRVAVLPHCNMEATKVYEKFKLDEPWDSPHNISLLKSTDYFCCEAKRPTETMLMVFRGPTTPFPMHGRKVPLLDIKDGPANTLGVVLSAHDRMVPWTKPADIDFDPERFDATLQMLPKDW